MGLDMYLKGERYRSKYATNPETGRYEEAPKPTGEEFAGEFIGLTPREVIYDLGQWRKQPDLHGYIVKTFADGKDNCQRIELDVKDLNQIIVAVSSKNLPHTEGFFFGSQDESDEMRFFTATAFQNAVKFLEAEDQQYWNTVSYEASW